MKAGYGISEITPPLGTELAGYGYYLSRKAKSVLDPLYARAVVLEDGGTRALIICCDVLGLSRPVCEEVFRHAEKRGIPSSQVMIVSIHTHTGPAVIYHEGCGYPDPEYVAGLGEKICQAVDAALSDRDEAQSLSFRMQPFEGDYVYNRASKDGPVDHAVRGFMLSRRSARPICLISAACHGVFRGRITAVSADYAGEINRLLSEKGYDSIFLNGVCGDIDPYQPSRERMEAFAQSVVNGFLSQERALPLSLKAGTTGFTLHHRKVTKEDIEEAAREAVCKAGGPDRPAAKVALIWQQEMLEKLDRLETEEPVTCKYLVLGGVIIIAVPFEGFTLIGQEIRSRTGRPDTLVLGCAEQLLGYLPTRDDISRGAYASLESTFLYKRLPVSPGEAERLGMVLGENLVKVTENSSEDRI